MQDDFLRFEMNRLGHVLLAENCTNTLNAAILAFAFRTARRYWLRSCKACGSI